ncbi:MAG: hypothetical protein K6E20_06225 [Acholeplasmatales bacterium]|nr:hypothetical protein [Acholeplasmatales bacterium]
MRKILKYMFIIISSILIFVLGGFAINAGTEQVIINSKISNFMKLGVYQEDISNGIEKYYKISMENENPGYIMSGSYMMPGYYGDIVTSDATFVVNELLSAIKNFNVGGHAAIVTRNYNDSKMSMSYYDSIEATGMEEDENVAQITNRTYWNDRDYFNRVICYRTKLSEEELDEVMSVASGHIGDPYNYNFTFDTTNKSYCSDLVSKAFDKVGLDLNKDGFWTTVWDIMVCPELYITYYHYTKDGVKYIYYVG